MFNREVFHSEFESLHLAHTAVRHKPPKPEFAKTFNVKVWNGATWVIKSVWVALRSWTAFAVQHVRSHIGKCRQDGAAFARAHEVLPVGFLAVRQ